MNAPAPSNLHDLTSQPELPSIVLLALLLLLLPSYRLLPSSAPLVVKLLYLFPMSRLLIRAWTRAAHSEFSHFFFPFFSLPIRVFIWFWCVPIQRESRWSTARQQLFLVRLYTRKPTVTDLFGSPLEIDSYLTIENVITPSFPSL